MTAVIRSPLDKILDDWISPDIGNLSANDMREWLIWQDMTGVSLDGSPWVEYFWGKKGACLTNTS